MMRYFKAFKIKARRRHIVFFVYKFLTVKSVLQNKHLLTCEWVCEVKYIVITAD